MEVFWEYARAFLCGGALCLIGQLLIDKTKLTPARILVLYVVSGVVLGGLGLYKYVVEFGGRGPPSPDRLWLSAGQGGREGRGRDGHTGRPHRRRHRRGGRHLRRHLLRLAGGPDL